MVSGLKTSRNEMKSSPRAKNLQQGLAPKNWVALVLAALAMTGMGGIFALPAQAQETRQNIIGIQKMDLSRMVVVGDSLSAGFQNDSLWDAQQPNGWASLLANQAQVLLVLPLIASPGIPNHLELISATFPPIVRPVPGPGPSFPFRDPPIQQATDLAVPDAVLQDVLTTQPSVPIDDFTDLILGVPGLFAAPPVSLSQVQWAQALQPTTIFVWIGNNDILGAATAANPSGATSLTSFNSSYVQMMNELAATHVPVVVANIADPTAAPFFTPASTIAEETGLPLFVLGPILGIGPGDYVLPAGIALIPDILSNPSLGPLPSSDVLRFFQVLEVRALIDAYNLIIAVQAFEHGAVLVDVHSLVNRLRSQGVEANGKHLTTAFLGGLFSLDGVHPTNTGYAIIANEFIATLNQTRRTSIPLVDIDAVACGDPLVFATAALSTSLAQHVSAEAAEGLRSALFHNKPRL
jgi:lysophospholipase L1-like esterase